MAKLRSDSVYERIEYQFPFKYKDFEFIMSIYKIRDRIYRVSFSLYDSRRHFEPYEFRFYSAEDGLYTTITIEKLNIVRKRIISEIKKYHENDYYRYKLVIPYYLQMCYKVYTRLIGKLKIH